MPARHAHTAMLHRLLFAGLIGLALLLCTTPAAATFEPFEGACPHLSVRLNDLATSPPLAWSSTLERRPDGFLVLKPGASSASFETQPFQVTAKNDPLPNLKLFIALDSNEGELATLPEIRYSEDGFRWSRWEASRPITRKDWTWPQSAIDRQSTIQLGHAGAMALRPFEPDAAAICLPPLRENAIRADAIVGGIRYVQLRWQGHDLPARLTLREIHVEGIILYSGLRP